jgi:hypothetical protein
MNFARRRQTEAAIPTRRQMALRKALRALAPHIPLADAEDVLARAGGGSLRELATNAAVWLALTSHVRHRYTDYDTLLGEGYDRDAARFFVVADTERQLAAWGCARPLLEENEE